MPLRLLAVRAAAFAGLLAVIGCAGGEKEVVVKGVVTYQGQPVTEGKVQFNDEKTGRGADPELQPDGGYETKLFPASYKVVILPPYYEDMSSGIPNPKYKKVDNIPKKYQSTSTSGLTADVSAESAKHDFSLKP